MLRRFPHAWLESESVLARVVGRPVARFLQIEAAGGILVLAAAVIALVWANGPWSESYEELWRTVVSFEAGDRGVGEDLRHWVNDGLMTLFFFVVGLEIKREVVSGQLSAGRAAALPVIAAAGGMVVPALVYLAFNRTGPGADGWGIPMATDIAFAVGVLALLGRRVPPALKVLLLGLAIADDIGAIVVIAVVYTEDIDLVALAFAGAGLVAIIGFRRARVSFAPAYVIVGFTVWLAVLESGVHATIAGVALAFVTPAGPVGTRLEEQLHPWTSYLVVPLFALANAGIPLSADAVADAASSPVTLGVVLGLVVGKFAGITAASALAVRLGVGRLPDGVRWDHVAGMAGIAGMGFTVSIFVTGLAFDDVRLQSEAKIGILVATAMAAVLGSAVLVRAGRRT